ncbi:50S ribosomal protein L25 [Patescibacteria group bacterium]|nr:50S ribosomal protein L25 [Patescibacteria group bacterium]MBU1931251.1 50S ribosomal protein L25 [Patescibacteria group bacterium]
MVNPQLNTESRKIFGRKVKTLRQQDLLPATVYGKELKSESLAMEQKSFNSIYEQVGETGLIDLNIKGEKKTRPVLVHNLQRHPVTNKPLHVEFHQVDLTKKVTVNIPVEITGEAPAVGKGGVLVTLLNEVEVEALPSDLPEKFEVDISGLKELGQSILVKDLKYDAKKIKILIEDLESPVVQVEEPAKEEEKEAPVAVEGEEAAEAETKEGKEEKKAEEKKQPEEDKKEDSAKATEGKQKKGKEGKK